MSEYTLAPALDRASINDYVDLFNHSFGGDGKLSAQYLQWQYVDNPDGRVIGVDAFSGETLAAHYAIIPQRYSVDGHLIEAALSVNTATHPQHQGKGLFTKLANATYDIAAQRGVRFVVGAANANSVGGFTRKLGFTELGQIRLYLGWRAAPTDSGSLRVAVRDDWMTWRLANPSRRYEVVRHGDGSATLRTRVNRVPFNLAHVDGRMIAPSTERCRTGLFPALTPHFGAVSPSGPLLPLRFQPSPWHMIWRALDPSCDMTLASRLRFDGISMDTF